MESQGEREPFFYKAQKWMSGLFIQFDNRRNGYIVHVQHNIGYGKVYRPILLTKQ